ncbi:MAG: DUF6279 family lipoprotein [Betaproteobacteria bacterium]|nr:hypothetical protein [Rhodocyclaceae bacterium]MCA3134145.1 hypothetical protein [Rhodocyclaceae bacterium]MCA3142563.1 hypothetical protein [Rhodocyclaceae bacterium]MCA3144312.1 hypothetical protein [Rhodocyclaceae bacterium]MCE2897376.1 DUF6279 family lipoprotein [Betaproteobacteria bacterium]
MRRARFIAASILMAVLAAPGCSRVQFAYGQAERVAAWTLEGYVPLGERQSLALANQLADFKQWHCRTQLMAYAGWLRQADAALRTGITAAQVEARFADVRGFGRTMAQEASPRLALLASSLTDRQLEQLARALEKGNRTFRREFVDAAYADVAAARAARTRERLEFWTGPLTREQRQVVDRWSAALDPSQTEMLHSRERWQAGLRAALAEHRDQPEVLRPQLEALFAEPERWYTPALRAKLEINRARSFAMIAQVLSLMTDAQKRRLSETSAALAADFEALACPAVKSAVVASP